MYALAPPHPSSRRTDPTGRDGPVVRPVRRRGSYLGPLVETRHPTPSLRPWVCRPVTRAHVRLLGPCFKTGRMGCRPISQGPWVCDTGVSPPPRVRQSARTANSPRESTRARGRGARATAGVPRSAGGAHRGGLSTDDGSTATLPPPASGHRTNRS